MTRRFAAEDGNLSTRPITTSRTVSYSDVDLTFAKKGSGDVFKKTDAAAVKQAVKNLLLTNFGEKPFQPYFGGDLNRFLFNLDTEFDEIDIQDAIAQAIANNEPRAIVRNINVRLNPDQNSVQAVITFSIANTTETQQINIDLTRLR